ncbi:MAG: acyltransferase [Pseudomonadota bacterium]
MQATKTSFKKQLKQGVKRLLQRTIGWPRLDELERLKRNGLRVGHNFHLLDGCIIDDSHYWHITIGDDVTLAPRVHILAHDASTKLHLNYTKIKNVTIGNRVFIGAGSIIMPGVTIGDDVIIGAGSLVARDVPSNTVYAGTPARFVCDLGEYLAKEQARMTHDNVFGEEYTLRGQVDGTRQAQMHAAVARHGVGYVI